MFWADLLAEAISRRISEELEAQALIDEQTSHVHTLARLSLQYPKRRHLRALIVQGAAAAETDAETRDRLREEQVAQGARSSRRFFWLRDPATSLAR